MFLFGIFEKNYMGVYSISLLGIKTMEYNIQTSQYVKHQLNLWLKCQIDHILSILNSFCRIICKNLTLCVRYTFFLNPNLVHSSDHYSQIIWHQLTNKSELFQLLNNSLPFLL